MSPRKRNTSKKTIEEPLALTEEELEDELTRRKAKLECLCPRCGRAHVMKLRWIGRGRPYKFCQHCRERMT